MASSDDSVLKLARALRGAILDAGLSLREVEDRCGMGRDYLSQLLRGTVDLKAKHVYQVLDAAGVSPAAFFAALHGSIEHPTPRREQPLSAREAGLADEAGFSVDSRLAEVEERLRRLEKERPRQNGGKG